LTKNGLGCILGDIFTNSSGHPAAGVENFQKNARENFKRHLMDFLTFTQGDRMSL
jgi:hypothetical protein